MGMGYSRTEVTGTEQDSVGTLWTGNPDSFHRKTGSWDWVWYSRLQGVFQGVPFWKKGVLVRGGRRKSRKDFIFLIIFY